MELLKSIEIDIAKEQLDIECDQEDVIHLGKNDSVVHYNVFNSFINHYINYTLIMYGYLVKKNEHPLLVNLFRFSLLDSLNVFQETTIFFSSNLLGWL